MLAIHLNYRSASKESVEASPRIRIMFNIATIVAYRAINNGLA